MLEWDPEKRASAQTMLNHPWLKMESNYDSRYSKEDADTMCHKEPMEEEMRVEMSKLGMSDEG